MWSKIDKERERVMWDNSLVSFSRSGPESSRPEHTLYCSLSKRASVWVGTDQLEETLSKGRQVSVGI